MNRRDSLRTVISCNRRAFLLYWKLAPQIFISSAVSAVLTSIAPYLTLYFTARLINGIASGSSREQLFSMASMLLGVTTGTEILCAICRRWKETASASRRYIESEHYFKKYLEMDFQTVEAPETQALHSQIQQNANWAGWGLPKIPSQFDKLVTSLMQVGGAVVLTWSLYTSQVEKGSLYVWLDSPFCLLSLSILLIVAVFLSPYLHNKGETYWTRAGDDSRLGNRVFRYFGFAGIHDRTKALDIRTYSQEQLFCQKLSASADALFTENCKIAKYAKGPMGGYYMLSEAVARVFLGQMYLFVCLKAYAGAFPVGFAVQYIGAVTVLFNGIAKCIEVFGDMRNNVDFLKSVFAFTDISNELYRGSLTTEKRADINYKIEFMDVSFKYPGSDRYALRHITMEIQVGKRLAIVGENGSGKTTFIKLLCRLYDPTEGKILLNGIDIRKYKYSDYMSLFSVLFQDFKLLALPLGQNVAGGMEYSCAEAEHDLQLAGLGEKMKDFPHGLESYLYKDLSKDGISVSGGEAQKIGLARTLYKASPFVILDEPTAALDPISEAEIYTRFHHITGDRTAVYISHRLSSCRFCDEIIVFDEGKLAQRGTHEALLAAVDGKYCQLWNAQAKYYI